MPRAYPWTRRVTPSETTGASKGRGGALAISGQPPACGQDPQGAFASREGKDLRTGSKPMTVPRGEAKHDRISFAPSRSSLPFSDHQSSRAAFVWLLL